MGIEFGSLSVCALTLWSGLVFFLNDLEPRLSQNMIIFFSVCLAVLNVLFIAWIVVKFVLAVLKEQHTKSAREKQKNKLELTKEEQESLSEKTKDKHDEDNEH